MVTVHHWAKSSLHYTENTVSSEVQCVQSYKKVFAISAVRKCNSSLSVVSIYLQRCRLFSSFLLGIPRPCSSVAPPSVRILPRWRPQSFAPTAWLHPLWAEKFPEYLEMISTEHSRERERVVYFIVAAHSRWTAFFFSTKAPKQEKIKITVDVGCWLHAHFSPIGWIMF